MQEQQWVFKNGITSIIKTSKDWEVPPPGYLDLRYIDQLERTHLVTDGMIKHVQSLIDCGSIHHTFHYVRGLAREMAKNGRIKGYGKVKFMDEAEAAYSDAMETIH